LKLRTYANAKPFAAPDGVVTSTIDPESGMPATPSCPETKPEVFIAGTEPVGTCPLHGGTSDQTTVSGWDLPSVNTQAAPYSEQPLPPRRSNGMPPPPLTSNGPNPAGPYPSNQNPQQQPPEKKRGFFGRLK